MRPVILPICTAIAFMLLAFAPAQAVVDPSQPAITYITGGIGEEERQALEATKPNYNLRMVSAHESGAFEGDMRIVIRDQQGREVINAEAGPLFYAKLPAGRYTVEATNGAERRTQTVNVGANRPANLHFTWKTSPG